MNEQLQQFFIQQAAAAAAAAAVFSSLWNGQQPPIGQNQQVQSSHHGTELHDSPAHQTTPTTTTTTTNTSTSTNTNTGQTNPLEALLSNASPVTLAALAQNFQKQQDGQTNYNAQHPMPDQQQAATFAAALRSSSNPSAAAAAAAAALNLPSVLQHQLNNLISSPSNHNQNSSNATGKQASGGNTSSSPSSVAGQQTQTSKSQHHQQHQQHHQQHHQHQQQSTYHQQQYNNQTSANNNSSNNQAISNQHHLSHNSSSKNVTSANHSTINTTSSSSADGGKIEVGLNMTTTALSSAPNTMQSSRATSSPVTNIQAPMNAVSHNKTSSSSHHHHHQSSHKQSASSSPREPISSSVLAKNNVGLPRKLVRGQDVWLGRGAEQTRQILKCMWCGQSCRTLADLSQHMKETQHYTNIVSQEQITSWRTPDNDLAQSQVNQVFTCKVCDEAFSSLNELSNHMVKKSHYNGPQPMSSPMSNYNNLVGGDNSSAQINLNQQNLLTTATANRNSPTLSNPDMQSYSQIGGSSHKKRSNMSSGSYVNDYDNRSVSPPMASSNSTKERRKKSLPVRKLLELERRGSGNANNRHNQAKNDSDNVSDAEDNERDNNNSSMAMMSRMLDRQETAYTADNDNLGTSDDDIGHNRDDRYAMSNNTSNTNNNISSSNHHIGDSRGRKRNHGGHNDDSDDDIDNSSENLDRSPRARLDQPQLSPVMSDHGSMNSSASASYKNQIHIDTTNLTIGQCSDCHNHQKKSSYRQKCKSCSNHTPLATSSTLLKPGTVSRQLLASLTNNKLDPDQVDEELLNRPLIYDENDDIKLNLGDHAISSESQAKDEAGNNDTTTTKESDEASPWGEDSGTRSQESKLDEKLANIKSEKFDNANQLATTNDQSYNKMSVGEDTKKGRPQTLSATVSPTETTKSGATKTKSTSNASSLSALEMLVEKSFDTKTRRGAQNTGILQRLGIDEEICPPWQHMNYASWYAAAAASYGGIAGNPMAAMAALPGYPMGPGMAIGLGAAGNMANSLRSHNNITPISSTTPPMRTPSSSPPTNASSPPNSTSNNNNNNKVAKSMVPTDQSMSNLQIEASSSPSLNSLMATTHQQMQSMTSASLHHHHSPHSLASSPPTAASMSSAKGLLTNQSSRANNKRSAYTNQEADDDDLDHHDGAGCKSDKSKLSSSRRGATSSSSRTTPSGKSSSKKAKVSDDSNTHDNSASVASNRYPRRSKTSTTLNKLKQQLESESEDEFEDYNYDYQPVSLAMKKSSSSSATKSSSGATLDHQLSQQQQHHQMQQLQLQLLQSQSQQQLPNEDVNQQSLAAMQATFLLKQLMTQAMASMVTGNQGQPTPENLASVQQYLLGNMLNQQKQQESHQPSDRDGTQHQHQQQHQHEKKSSNKNSLRRFSDDNDDEGNDRDESDDGDCIDFTSSSSSVANAQQQHHEQQQYRQPQPIKSSSRGRKSSTKKQAPVSKKSTCAPKRSSQDSSSSSTNKHQQDISNSKEVPVGQDDRCTVASSSDEHNHSVDDHSLLKRENGKSSRRRKQQTKRDGDDADADDDDRDGDNSDGDDHGDDGLAQVENRENRHNVMHDDDEEQVTGSDNDNQSSGKSIIGAGSKINVDNDLNDSTAANTASQEEEKDISGDHDGSSNSGGSGEDDRSSNIDRESDKKHYHHHESIGQARTGTNQGTQVSVGGQAIQAKEDNGSDVDSSTTGDGDDQAAKRRELNSELEEEISSSAARDNDEKESSQEIAASLDHDVENKDSMVSQHQSNKKLKGETGSNDELDDGKIEDLSAIPATNSGKQNEITRHDETSGQDDETTTTTTGLDHQMNHSKCSPSAIALNTGDMSSEAIGIKSATHDVEQNVGFNNASEHENDSNSNDDDNDDGMKNFITSSSFDAHDHQQRQHQNHKKSLKNSKLGQQQTVIAPVVNKTNGDSNKILKVKP